jgi:predicted amidophosphoribosyltransferase
MSVAPALRMRALTRDSVGLGSGARERNIAGRVLLSRRRLRPGGGGDVLIVDDVVTTGATLAESVRVLRSGGVAVVAALVIAAA